jgi:N-methylhydantoinase A
MHIIDQVLLRGGCVIQVGAAHRRRQCGYVGYRRHDSKGKPDRAGWLTYADEWRCRRRVSRGGQLQRGGGYVLRAPTLDISEIGAGGGSIV